MITSAVGIDKTSLERFIRVNEDILKTIPTARRRALYAAATAAQKEVRAEIDQRVDDSRGRVKRWQEVVMGSRGGYSKVAPSKVPVANRQGKYSGYNAAQITGFINHGHGVRAPSGKAKRNETSRYSGKLVWNDHAKRRDSTGAFITGVVPGRMFYSWSRERAAQAGLEAMYEVMDQIADDWQDLLADL